MAATDTAAAQRARGLLRRARAALYAGTGGSRRAQRRLDGTAAVVLAYHRVLPAAEARGVEPGMYVTPETFRRQLRWLSRDFCVLPASEIVAALAAGRPLPPRACAITFDDGWRDNYTHAWPVLRELGLPATVFLVTARVGTPGGFWPDRVWARLRERAEPERRELAAALLGRRVFGPPEAAVLAHLKTLPDDARARALERLDALAPGHRAADARVLLDWAEIEEMARGGIAFESHGASHAILTTVPAERARAELREARRALEARGLGRAALVAYPSGAFDAAVLEAARACGYRGGFSIRPGVASAHEDPLALPRVSIHEDIAGSYLEFRYQVPGQAWRERGGAARSRPEAEPRAHRASRRRAASRATASSMRS